ncbi:MAG: hypothetical protein WA896_07220, partial [Spirulinaceae cyanobacterium]
MTISKKTRFLANIKAKNKRVRTASLWFERLMAILAAINLILVLFDLSYIPLRNFWLQGRINVFGVLLEVPLPPVTDWYDPIKGIEPERDTTTYLKQVEELENQLIGETLTSPDVAKVLEELRFRSMEMIDTNPFEIANKTGTLERIKNRMREHIFDTEDASSKEAFQQFWSQEYLTQNNAKEELEFFNTEIRPLMEINYYRPIGENGEPFDRFGFLDFPFVVVFAIELIARSWFISRSRTGVSWLDAILWRWYDIFLLIPVFRWLRFIPVTIRLSQARLIDLNAIKKQASQGFVAGIAEDLTEVVIVSTLNQVQGSVRRGEIAKMISRQEANPYIDINNTNETAEITKLVIEMFVYQVLPKIKPDVEALLQHNISKVFTELPAHEGMQMLPGVETIERNLIKQLSARIFQTIDKSLQGALKKDKVNEELMENLIEKLSKVLAEEIQAKQTIETIQSLLDTLIEEIKINYVERLSQEDVEEILEQTRALRQMTQNIER